MMSRESTADSALHSHHSNVLWCALNEGQRSRSGEQGQTICRLQYQVLSISQNQTICLHPLIKTLLVHLKADYEAGMKIAA